MKLNNRIRRILGNYLRSKYPHIDIEITLIDSFTWEVYCAPSKLYECFYSRKGKGLVSEYLDQIRLVNVIGSIYFRRYDNLLDGHDDSILEDRWIVREYEQLLGRYNLKLVEIVKAFKQSGIPPITENKIIARNRIYYLPFLTLFDLTFSQIESLNLYLLAKQYIDDLKDFNEDFTNSRYSLFHRNFGLFTEVDCSERIAQILVRVEYLLDNAEKDLRSYHSYRKLKNNFIVVKKIWKIQEKFLVDPYPICTTILNSANFLFALLSIPFTAS